MSQAQGAFSLTIVKKVGVRAYLVHGSVTFVFPDGAKVDAKGKEGDNLLDIIINDNVEIDGFGACEGTLACSTCHLIFSQEVYDKLPEEPTDVSIASNSFHKNLQIFCLLSLEFGQSYTQDPL